MSINVLHIPFSYRGSTKILLEKALEKIKGPDYSTILYLAPSQMKIQDAQTLFHDRAGDCYIPPAMMTVPQLATRLFTRYENRRIMRRHLMPIMLSRLTGRSIGYACLIADFLSELKEHYPGKDATEMTDDILFIFRRLGIPEEVSDRAMEAMKSLQLYESILRKHDTLDENDIMALCPHIVRKQNVRYEVLIIDSLIELKQTDEDIIKALIDNSNHTIIAIPHDAHYNFITDRYLTFFKRHFTFATEHFLTDNNSLHAWYSSYQDSEEEITGIVRRIKNHFIEGTGTDLEKVFVVFPQIHPYFEMITRIFQKYGIPFTITSQRPLGKTKPFLDLLAVLESVSKDYPRLTFSQFLVSPFFKAIPTSLKEYIPSICISSGLIYGKKVWMNLLKSDAHQTRGDIFGMQTYKIIARDLTAVFRKLSYLESIRHHASYADFSKAVLRLLNDFDFDVVMNRDRNHIETLINVLNDLSLLDVFTDDSPTDLRHYTDALKHCLLNVASEQAEITGVRVMSFKELYGLEPEYLYVGGLRDGDFPKKPEIDHLMPDNVRTELGLVNMERSIQQQNFHFRKALLSARHHYLSYSMMEGDRTFLPSSFLSWNQEIPKTLCGVFSKEEELIHKASIRRLSLISDIGNTNRKELNKLFGKKSAIRATDIDAYRTCPRRFFIERILDLKPLDIIKFELDAMTLGTIIHEIMQAIIPDFSPGIDTFIAKAQKKIEALLSKKPIELFWKLVVKNALLSDLPVVSKREQEIADDGYVFLAAEVPVQSEVLPGIALKGKIDRIDTKGMVAGLAEKKDRTSALVKSDHALSGMTDVELIDYKTGTIRFSGSQILSHGAPLQLLLYAAMMNSLGISVERVGIYSLKDLSLTWIPGREDRKKSRTMNDFVAAALRFLEETVVRMRAGEFPAHPLNDLTCRNCSERPYCPYVQRAIAQ